MRVATWNINGLKARLPYLEHWLEARSPDIVGLQELKMTDEQFPHMALESQGYHALTHGQKAWNGVAVLSRRPGEVIERGLPGQGDFGARLLHVRFPELDFLTVYCPNGKSLDHADFERKLAWFDTLAEYVGRALDPKRPALVGGDFNICPGPLDSWDPDRFAEDIFHTDQERKRLGRLLDWGLTDTFRDRKPDAREYSWWDYRGGAFHRKQGLRIDFLLATDAALAAVDDVTIDRDYRKKVDGMTASDHAPVIAELKL